MACYIEQVVWHLLILLGFAGVAAAMVAETVSGPVSRPRVEAFARRQRLDITPDNGNQVIRYLATTRRWRAAGLACGVVLSVGPHLPTQLRFQPVWLFTGWFAGALVAEARVAHLGFGARRAASLQRRRPSTYLPRLAWALVPAAAAVALAVAAGTALLALTDRADPDWWAGAWLVAALLLAAAVRGVQRVVLRRPQPFAPADVLAADDAIRSRSLHVLAGGGAALVMFCVFGQLGAVGAYSEEHTLMLTALSAAGAFVVAAVGGVVATSSWGPRRRPAATAEPA